MSKIYTTEITSDQIASDNPLHQRLLKPYVVSNQWIKGDLLEIGCGEGRGIDWLLPSITSYSAIDKIESAVTGLRSKYPSGKFVSGHLPPLPYDDSSFDSIVSFQVIEHIEDDSLYLKEISRVLRPGGIALITTPNRLQSLSRNPWHVREYTAPELTQLAKQYFPVVEMKGVSGNEKVITYHERNRASVNKIMRWDIFDLQHRLPAAILRIPYDLLNRANRNKLQTGSDDLVSGISSADYLITDSASDALDLFLIVGK
ncbi:class I SAM-dependent methyltransferase [soil metagenome]